MLDIAHTIVNTLEEKKGEEILLLDIQKIANFTDYFIICSGTSDRMLDALVDAVVQKVNQEHQINGNIEGKPEGGWMLIDSSPALMKDECGAGTQLSREERPVRQQPRRAVR